MKQALLISAAGLLFLGAVEAQEQPRLVIRTQKNGKQVTTTLEPVFPPAAKAPGDKKGDPALPKEVGRATATGVVLAAMDWKCGR
ncbi:MAG TPA: hypothetical protein VEL76_23175, partial [Gemmataceae bacterium]|nr:hypothetical protein [Gemmataceae bacterium]